MPTVDDHMTTIVNAPDDDSARRYVHALRPAMVRKLADQLYIDADQSRAALVRAIVGEARA